MPALGDRWQPFCSNFSDLIYEWELFYESRTGWIDQTIYLISFHFVAVDHFPWTHLAHTQRISAYMAAVKFNLHIGLHNLCRRKTPIAHCECNVTKRMRMHQHWWMPVIDGARPIQTVRRSVAHNLHIRMRLYQKKCDRIVVGASAFATAAG